jgi:hypothetical protein
MTYAGPLEALDRVLNRGGDADDVLREVVAIVSGPFAWAGILFREDGRLVLGPAAGDPDESRRTSVPVSFQGSPVAELAVDGELDDAGRAFVERVALLISPYCLVGWDTGGEEWTP